MSAFSHLVSLLPAGLALALMPGPSNLLSVQLAASDGVAAACRAGLGRLVAFALLLAAAAGGLAVVLRHAPAGLGLVQAAAAAYLLSIAVRLWREAGPPAAATAGTAAADVRTADAAPPPLPPGRGTAATHSAAAAAWRREFLLALGNPKCLLIATALVPQCVDPARPAAPQLLAASLAVLALEALRVGAYAAAGRSLLRWLSSAAHWRRFGRACALAMGAASVALLWRTWAV